MSFSPVQSKKLNVPSDSVSSTVKKVDVPSDSVNPAVHIISKCLALSNTKLWTSLQLAPRMPCIALVMYCNHHVLQELTYVCTRSRENLNSAMVSVLLFRKEKNEEHNL